MKKKATLLTFVFLFGSFAAGYVMLVSGKEVYRGKKIEQEVEKLRLEAEKIKSENYELRDKITYLDTDQFRERIAKEKLNLKKEGETVIEVRPSGVLGEETIEESQALPNSEYSEKENLKNYEKWWKQFFSY